MADAAPRETFWGWAFWTCKTQLRHLMLFRSLQRAAFPSSMEGPSRLLLFIKMPKIGQNPSIPLLPLRCDPPQRDEGSPKVPKSSYQARDKNLFFSFLDLLEFVHCIGWGGNKKSWVLGKDYLIVMWVQNLGLHKASWDLQQNDERFGSWLWSACTDSNEWAKNHMIPGSLGYLCYLLVSHSSCCCQDNLSGPPSAPGVHPIP